MARVSNTYTLTLTGSSGGNLAPGYGSVGSYFYSPATYSPGYQCTNCGSYVYYGCTHFCSYRNVWPMPIYIYPTVLPTNMKELEDKLDELTDEVKKLRKELKKKT